MNPILDTLSEMTCDVFGWPAHENAARSKLIAAGIEPAEAVRLLADLQRRAIPKQDEQWQSCDACWDPGRDEDPFDRSGDP